MRVICGKSPGAGFLASVNDAKVRVAQYFIVLLCQGPNLGLSTILLHDVGPPESRASKSRARSPVPNAPAETASSLVCLP